MTSAKDSYFPQLAGLCDERFVDRRHFQAMMFVCKSTSPDARHKPERRVCLTALCADRVPMKTM